MIRFDCPTCGRGYALPDAMAGLPLLCKKCGQRLTLPAPQPDPDPTPDPPAIASAPSGEVVAERSDAAGGGVEPESVTRPLPPTRRTASRSSDLPHAGGGEDHGRPEAAGAGRPSPKTPAGRRLIAVVVDVAVVLVLLAAGMMAGEEVVGKPTRQVLADAEAAPRFPPTELLLWAACPAVLVLVYAWLGTRGWTVGGWLKRR